MRTSASHRVRSLKQDREIRVWNGALIGRGLKLGKAAAGAFIMYVAPR
jgi:hypothetical protein